jgi:hypothetical protein
VPAECQHCGSKDKNTNEGLKQGRSYSGPREQLERKHDSFHEVLIGDYQAGRTHDAIGEEGMDNKSSEKNNAEIDCGQMIPLRPPGGYDDSENKCVHGQHQSGVKE